MVSSRTRQIRTASYVGAGIIGGGSPVSKVRQVASNVRPPGFNGVSLSNGTDTTANFVTAHWNESGKALTELATLDVGWQLDTVSESDLTDDFTITRAITYPFNTTVIGVVTWGGQQSKTIAAGSLVNQSDWIALMASIPADAKFGIHTFVSVAAGKKFPFSGVGNNTALGERKEIGTGLTDKTQTLGVANALPALNIYRPAAILSRGVGLKNSIAGVGDSIMAGTGDGSFDARGGTGIYGRAAAGVAPFMHIAVAGTKITDQVVAGKFARRLALLQAAGVTHVVTNFAANDIAFRTAAQIQADLQTFWNLLANALNTNGEKLKVLQATVLPQVTTNDNYRTFAGQTAKADFTGSGSKRGVLNAFIRGKPAPIDDYIETADAVEIARNDGRFAMGSAFSAHFKDPINGNVTSGSTTTVVNMDVPGGLNALQNAVIVFTSGANAGTVGSIASSNTGFLNLSAALSTAPSAGDTFTLYPAGSQATNDGVHPINSNSTAPGYGAVFVAMDVVKPVMQALAG